MHQQDAPGASSKKRNKAKFRRNAMKAGPDAIQVETLTHLNENQIYLLESKSRLPFHCQVCGLHLPSLGASLHHANQSSHNANLLTAHVKQVLLHLPAITDVHRDVLNHTLQSALKDVLVNGDEIQRRQKFAGQLVDALQHRVPELKLTGVGSTWTGLVLPDSDVNLNVSYMDCSPEAKSNVVRISVPPQDLPQTLVVPNDSVMRNPGLGYLLVKVFDVLKINARSDPPKSPFVTRSEALDTVLTDGEKRDNVDGSGTPDKFPEIYNVIRTDAEHFSISFCDSHDVYYRLTTGSPHGDLQADLIRTYLGLTEYGLQLATLFRKLAKLAHLDMPLNGTFSSPVLSILVIFYLQHCTPSRLPNLHTLYQKHRSELPPGSYREVYYCDEDLSYLTDPTLIQQYWKAELMDKAPASAGAEDSAVVASASGPSPAAAVRSPDLADLWLGLLRFYLFDFQRSKCTVNIVKSKPVLRKGDSYGLSALVVTAPFDPCVNLCKSIASCGFQYIFSQLLACYGYFGVPRLTTGRHVFTHVRVHKDESKQPAELGHQEAQQRSPRAQPPPQATTTGGSNVNQPKGSKGQSVADGAKCDDAAASVLHFTPIIDDTDQFSTNLLKIHSLCVEKFASERRRGSSVDDDDDDDRMQSTNDEDNNKEASAITVPLSRLVPHLLRLVLDEILDSEDVPAIADRCLEKMWTKLNAKLPVDLPVSMTELKNLCDRFARPFWYQICNQFINRGLMTVSQSLFVKKTSYLLRSAIVHSFLKLPRAATAATGDANVEVDLHKDRSSEPMDDSNGAADVVPKNNVPDLSPSGLAVSDEDSDAQYQDAEGELMKDPQEPSSVDEGDFEENNGDADDADIEVDSDDEDEVLDETRESGAENHDLSVTRFGDGTEDGACEYAERTLDLGDDDVEHYDEDGDGSFLTEQRSSEQRPDTATPTGDSVSLGDQMFRAVEALKSSEAGRTTGEPTLDKASSGSDEQTASKKKQQKQQDDSSNDATGTVITPTNHARRTAGARAPKRARRAQDSAATLDNGETAGKLKAVTRGQTGAESETWSSVIRPQSTVSEPVDDDRPDFYHSKVVQSLRPEDLSFPFTAWGQLSHKGGHAIRSSVLGLTAANQPSTMLAHFTCPEPQCKACGQVGHRSTMCKTAIDQSVSFAAWQKHRSETPRLPPPGQIQALSDCLLELASFHDCSEQMVNRKVLLDILEKVFASRFPSVMLKLFGSCANGFELPSSDMDLCVFFPRESPQWRQLQRVDGMLQLIRDFKRHLFRISSQLHLTHIRAILHAKVPILKVRFVDGFEVDISFSNYLALRNTQMLKLYTEIEPGLRVLGIALKVVGKLCHIANASIGGVSSYALIIMLIHYLQQRDQLPVLQELYEGEEKPVVLINGWNAWFQDDKSVINRLWKRPKQKLPLGDLWLGFFHYFLFEFDRDVNVVSIRQKTVLTRFLKMWTSLFAVEDPFNLDHNLTGGLCRDSFLCVLDVFYAVLLHHTTFIPLEMPIQLWRYLLFCPKSLAEKRRLDAPAKSRCNRCHQCGHRAADCPLKDRHAVRPPNDAPDASVHALIGPFLRGQLNAQVWAHGLAPPPAHPGIQMKPARGRGPVFQPYALLPTPHSSLTAHQLDTTQFHHQIREPNSYAGFGQPQAPYSHNRPYHGQQQCQPQQQPPMKRTVLYSARAHAHPGMNRSFPMHGSARPSLPRSADQLETCCTAQQPTPRASIPAQPRHPPPRHYYHQQQQRNLQPHFQGNHGSNTSGSTQPNWTDDPAAYSHHFPPPPTHQSQRAPRPIPNEQYHDSQQQQPVRFTNPVTQSTPTKPVAQPTSGSAQQALPSRNHQTPRNSAGPDRSFKQQVTHSGPSVGNSTSKNNNNTSKCAVEQPLQKSASSAAQSNPSRRRGRFIRNTIVKQNETVELAGRLQKMSTRPAAAEPE